MKKIILIDNYDSFTFNLYHYLSSLKVKVDVIRNDQITSNKILKRNYNYVSKPYADFSSSFSCFDFFW